MALVGKGVLAAGSALSRKASSALVKRAAKRKAERAAKAKAKKAAERAASRAATRAKEIKAAQNKANRAKTARSGTTPKKPSSAYKEGHGKINPKTKGKTTGKSKKLSPREERGLGSNRAISLARRIGATNTITRKISRYPKKVAKNKFVQMSALSGVSGYIGAKTAGGSSNNTVSNKSSYTQADYDEARKRIYGR